MARTTTRRRTTARNRTTPATTAVPTNRRTTSRRSMRVAGSANDPNTLLPYLLRTGNEVVGRLKAAGIAGAERVGAAFGEITQALVGPNAFTGTVPATTTIGQTTVATSSTTTRSRRTRGGRARGGITVAQQTVLNVMQPGAQLTRAQIVSMIPGSNATAIGRSISGLKTKGLITQSGRGANAWYSKPAQPMQQTGT